MHESAGASIGWRVRQVTTRSSLMQNSITRTLALAAFALFVAAGAAQAQGKAKGHGHGHDADDKQATQGRGHGHDADDDHGTRVRGRGQDQDRGQRIRDHDRDDEQGRGYGNGGMPPGLAKKGGMPPGLAKTGGVPPGQLKKYYQPDEGVSVLDDVLGRHGYTVVRTVPSGAARYVYYRYHNGSVHRAIVRPNNHQLSFSNVPNALLREVIARLH